MSFASLAASQAVRQKQEALERHYLPIRLQICSLSMSFTEYPWAYRFL